MPLHLVKLCVGIDDPDQLRRVQAARLAEGGVVEARTRMMPRRRDEVLAGGSLYWVIRQVVRVRQRILGLEPATDPAEGRPFCRILLDPALVPVSPRAWRPFQGWRYLSVADAPPDLGDAPGETEEELMPEAMLAELRALGLL